MSLVIERAPQTLICHARGIKLLARKRSIYTRPQESFMASRRCELGIFLMRVQAYSLNAGSKSGPRSSLTVFRRWNRWIVVNPHPTDIKDGIQVETKHRITRLSPPDCGSGSVLCFHFDIGSSDGSPWEHRKCLYQYVDLRVCWLTRSPLGSFSLGRQLYRFLSCLIPTCVLGAHTAH